MELDIDEIYRFPAVRACTFDMDSLLINTARFSCQRNFQRRMLSKNMKDVYTLCANNVLEKYGRPHLPWSIKAKLMGVPGCSIGDTFH
jgi:pseudouridine-5'-monophosphatase